MTYAILRPQFESGSRQQVFIPRCDTEAIEQLVCELFIPFCHLQRWARSCNAVAYTVIHADAVGISISWKIYCPELFKLVQSEISAQSQCPSACSGTVALCIMSVDSMLNKRESGIQGSMSRLAFVVILEERAGERADGAVREEEKDFAKRKEFGSSWKSGSLG
jgi:hypothetical protein